MRSYDYFHSDDPVEAAKFVVSDAVAVLWDSVLRNDGPAAFASRVPEQLIRWESDFGWTRAATLVTEALKEYRSLARLREGMDLGTGGHIVWSRDTVHER